jgi:hypothetical protein
LDEEPTSQAEDGAAEFWAALAGDDDASIEALGLTLQDEAAETAQGLRESDYEVTLDSVRLPAGEASHIDGTGGSWEISIFVLARDDRFHYLECGHADRHDDQWLEVAESFEFLQTEP